MNQLTQTSINKLEKFQILYLLILIFFSFYYALGSYPLLNNNEGLYASIAKHMLLSKKFIIPYLNCVPYIEKPPMLYWFLSLSFSIFGFTASAARLVTATSATLICLALLYFSQKIRQLKFGIMAVTIFTSSIIISIIARMVYFDMLLTFFVSAALLNLFYWYTTKKIIALRLAYAFIGLAILTKGLIAIIIILGSFSLFLILEKNFWHNLKQMIDWPGILLLLAIILPWHIIAVIQHKGFFWNYIIGEHFLRFLNLREPHDYYNGPIYYYLPRITIYLFPWSFFIPLVFLRPKNHDATKQKLLRFCWSWLLIPLVFFSLSSAKANYYMIVSMPALAILLGIAILDLSQNYPRFFNTLTAIILLILAVSVAFALTILIPTYPQLKQHTILILGTGIYCLSAALLAIIFIRNSRLTILMLAGLIIPTIFIMTTCINVIIEDLSSANSGIYLAQNAKQKNVYLYKYFEGYSALSFYANGCFKIIDNESKDLYYGHHLPQFKQWFVSTKEFAKETNYQQFLVVVPNKLLEEFYQKLPNTKKVEQKKYKDVTIVHSE